LKVNRFDRNNPEYLWKYAKEMRLFEIEPLLLSRKQLGHNFGELDKKQINSIDKTYQRFTSLCKRIELKLNCHDSIFIYPDQYESTQSASIISPNWNFQIFPSIEAFNLKLGYSFCFAENLFFSFDCFNKELDVRRFPNYHRTFYTTYISQTIYDFSFIDQLVSLIKSIDLSLDIYTRESDHLKIFRSGLFSSFDKERELNLKLSRLKPLNKKIDKVPDKTFELLFRIKAILFKKIKPNFFKIVEDNHIENIISLQLFFQDQDEPDDFQARAQRGKRKDLPSGPQPKHKRRVINGQTQWARDPNITYTALDNASFTCEFDVLHTTLTSATHRMPIMQGHHLVPMDTQNIFPASLDVPENIICLCPNCHAAIHQAIMEEKIKIIESFFQSRQEALEHRQIIVSLAELLSFYNALDRARPQKKN